MKKSLFDFSNYKEYLQLKIEFEAEIQKSYRTKLCDYIGIQASYLSQVINGKPNLTLEQAFKLCDFFTFDQSETKYFLLLIEKERAGTKDLENYFLNQIREFQQTRFDLKKRLKKTEDISEEDQHKYYSTWFYSAIYVLISIPEFQTKNAIASRLGLPMEIVNEALNFLESCGLVDVQKGRYQVTKKSLHLNRDSIFIQRHHINWRSQSLQSVEKNLKNDLHYSTVLAISKNDFDKIKEVYIKAIEEGRHIIGPSKEEEIYCITLDLFKL